MKISKIKKICTDAKQCYIYTDDGGRQWIGDYAAIYPLEGMPELPENGIRMLLDIEVTKWADFYVPQVEGLPEGCDEDELTKLTVAKNTANSVTLNDSTYLAIEGQDASEVLFINGKYLAPVESETSMVYLAKTGSGRRCVAVYDGIFLTALIMPIQVGDALSGWLFSMAAAAGRQCRERNTGEEAQE